MLATGPLIVLAAPVAAIRLGFGDAGNRPRSDTTREAHRLVLAAYPDPEAGR